MREEIIIRELIDTLFISKTLINEQIYVIKYYLDKLKTQG
jgi:hypothetical protein